MRPTPGRRFEGPGQLKRVDPQTTNASHFWTRGRLVRQISTPGQLFWVYVCYRMKEGVRIPGVVEGVCGQLMVAVTLGYCEWVKAIPGPHRVWLQRAHSNNRPYPESRGHTHKVCCLQPRFLQASKMRSGTEDQVPVRPLPRQRAPRQ